MLECRHLSVTYGQHAAVQDVDLNVEEGEIVVILGANGAGKTSLLNAIAGRVTKGGGAVVNLLGKSLNNMPAHRIVDQGLALVPEGRGLFGELSVYDNLILGAYTQRARDAEQQHLAEVYSLFPKLESRRNQTVRTMSGGEQQMVAIGRALMSSPVLLMLDEPSLGLSPLLTRELFESLARVRQSGVGILLVEQNARQALAIGDRGYLLENGRIAGQGPTDALLHDPAVIAAYLGGAEGHRDIKPAVSNPSSSTKKPLVPVHVINPDNLPPVPQSADSLLGVSVDELVNQATYQIRQAQSVGAAEPSPNTVRYDTTNDPAIARAVADIEAAAQNALNQGAPSRPAKTSAPVAHRSTPDRLDLPTIEVIRKPQVEVYKRDQYSGKLKRTK